MGPARTVPPVMKNAPRTALAALCILLGAVTFAQAQNTGLPAFMQNAPGQTVLGRLSPTPGVVQPIPFASLVDRLHVGGTVINAMAAPYNATCNGSASDTAAFNAAIVAANAAGGGVVTAEDGHVCIIQSGTSIVLQNNTCIKGNFTLRGTSATNNTEMIFAISKTNVCVADVTIDMINSFVDGNLNNVAISTFNTSILIENVKIVNQGNIGIGINGGQEVRIRNNIVKMNSPYGSGHQTQSILATATNAPLSAIIDGNILDGSGINAVGQRLIITNNKIKNMRFGGGIGTSTLVPPACDYECVGNTIAFNEVSSGVGVDDTGTIMVGIEIFDRRGIVVGNRVWDMDGEGIHGGAAVIADNVVYDNCMRYTATLTLGGCNGTNTRKDVDDGSDTIWSGNRVFNSFGAPMAVLGTVNSAGVIRLTVASTATIGQGPGTVNEIVPCRVEGVGGTTNANLGWRQCKIIDATHIELIGSVFNSAWTSGGTVGGTHDYSYSETGAGIANVRLSTNNFGPGFLGTANLTSATTGLYNHGRHHITSNNSSALAVGPNGGTNPSLQVDSSAANAATGVKITAGAAAGGGVNIAAISSNANEGLSLNAKGSQGLNIADVSTGNINLFRNTTIAGTQTNTAQSATALTVGRQGATNPALQVDSNAASSVTGVRITTQAAGNGVNFSTQSTGTDEPMSINAKGAGILALNDVGTGNIYLARATKMGAGLGIAALSGTTGVPIQGSSTNFAVAAGDVGQKIQCTPVTSGSPLNLVNNTPKDLCSMTLTAGNWMVWCNPVFKTQTTTTVSYIASSISTATVTIQTGVGQYASQIQATAGVANSTLLNIGMPMGAYYTSLAGSTNHFCVVQAGFGVSTMDVYGGMWAIRAP
jgi:hypothetical protein